jgi:8-oxo-dGTP pyrophosphatase MutT (NUDIX family)
MAKSKKTKQNYIGAGIVFVTPKKEILLLQKSNKKLTFPGGHRESYEDDPFETAKRECIEEISVLPHGKILGKLKITKDELPIYSYFMSVPDSFMPVLSSEHDGYTWIHYKKVKSEKLTTVFKPYWKIYKRFIEDLL